LLIEIEHIDIVTPLFITAYSYIIMHNGPTCEVTRKEPGRR